MPTLERTEVSVKKILFATDFSPCSEAALPLVESIAGRFGSDVYLAHVLSPMPSPAAHGDACEHLADVTSSMRRRGLKCDTLLLDGNVTDRLTEIVQAYPIDLIVAGSHARHALGRLMLGSVAETMAHVASCPVLVVGPNAVSHYHVGDPVRRILFATDFAPHAARDLNYAVCLARTLGARLSLLTVLIEHGHHAEVHGVARMRQLMAEQDTTGCEIDYIVRYGPPAPTIVKDAVYEQADMIVLGGGANKVVGEAPCAVMIVPPEAKE